MQTSASPATRHSAPAPHTADRPELSLDKGQKSEPFFIPAIGRDRQSRARELRLDQRR